jgi:hypothetical protein
VPHDLAALLAVYRRTNQIGKPKKPVLRRSSEGLRICEIRIGEHGVTRRTPTDPLLAFILSEVFTPLDSASCFHVASSHGLSHLAGQRTAHLDIGSAEFQRTRG